MIYYVVTLICFHCFVVGAILTSMDKEKIKLPSLLAAVIHGGLVVWGLTVVF
jgi:hypothetical protein